MTTILCDEKRLRARLADGQIALAHLRDLVDALDRTNWSSWQTTAPFRKELDNARDYLRDQN